MEINFKIILGNILYPKSKSIIIPANMFGLMNKGVQARIVKYGWRRIIEEAKTIILTKKPELGQCFVTTSGRLKRRGLKKIYHAIIKKFPSDLVTINIIRKALSNALEKVIKDKMTSVSICGIGIEPGELDTYTVALSMIEVCRRFDHLVEIKIIDDNKQFINDLNRIIEEK